MPLASATRSQGAAAAPGRIPAAASRVVFVLNTSNPAPGAAHDVEIVSVDNRMLWSGTGLTQNADGTLTLVVPRALLELGARIRLYEPKRHTLLEQYLVPALSR
jgi:hypothetical protein